ncbi:hypothetical protein KSP40_PGU018616 [Platanthera guangdongensis]|uniref:DUF7722 domain-containing protein n=1 Tax=Platanthera guangdongensis TaxID=2320717 RepID=A0ABR2M458_9ASPA
MPVNYPRYSRAEYESMPEWKLDFLLTEYGLPVGGSLEYKRNFAAGAFLWEVFKMPVNYPRYSRAEYESMPEWKLDFLLTEYGLPVGGSLEYKRNFAAGAFLWSPSG